MATSAIPTNPTIHNVASLVPKLSNPDPDIRFMSLNDLSQMLTVGAPQFISHDYSVCAKVVDGLLSTLNDGNGDVQNMAIKCLGPFVNRAPENILCPLFDKVSNLSTSNTVDDSVPALATRAIVVALPRPIPGVPRNEKVEQAYSAVSRALIPRLVGRIVMPLPQGRNLPSPPKGMIAVEMETGTDSNALDLLIEVARCFGPMLQDPEVEALQRVTMEVLESPRCGSVMKKKATAALSALAPYFSDMLLSAVVSHSIESLRNAHLTPAQRRLYLTIYASIARAIPRKFGPYLKTLAPFVLAPLSQEEMDQQQDAMAEDGEGASDPQFEEVREASLIALDAFLASCPQDMEAYNEEVIEAALRFLRYDPNYAMDDDDEMDELQDDEDDDFGADEDFEEETGFDDEDDVSWKVRRCAAKLIHTLIATRSAGGVLDSGLLYQRIAPALISRFQEREESVRLEVLSTLAFLIKKTGESVTGPPLLRRGSSTTGPPAPYSRKRRRGSSDVISNASSIRRELATAGGYASPTGSPPKSQSQANLAKINPEIVKGSTKLLKSSTIPTKHAAICLLADLVTAQHGGLESSVDSIVDPVLDAMKSTSSSLGGSTVTTNTLHIETLRLLRFIAETHTSRLVEPHLSKIIPLLTKSVTNKFSRIASEAFDTIEVYIKTITPPRAAGMKPQNGQYLQQLYQVICERVQAADTDTEVRQKAVHALGLLVARTSGSQGSALLNQESRSQGLQIIAERLHNELTRLASVRAIDTVAYLASSKDELKPEWVREVSLELGAQLRKASRSLRGSSLSALKRIATNAACRENLDDSTITQIIQLLLPLILIDKDLHLIGPALIIIGTFANDNPKHVLDSEVVRAYCFVARMDISGNALDALLDSVHIIGKKGAGVTLMQALLNDVGINGNPELVGQVIGTLLVAGGGWVGVHLEDFIKELKTTKDEKRRCLALYVLGEAGLRMGSTFPLDPNTFTSYFADKSEKVPLAAAVALGRAAAGNVAKFLPQILSLMGQGKQYLLLHSVKELLQHDNAEADLVDYTEPLWTQIIAASQLEDNKVVGAECMGRLATIDPAAYLPQLEVID